MKKIVAYGLMSLLMSTSATVSAQVNSYKSAVMGANSVAYALPQTVIKVTLVIEKESIRKGPYARFAQKYLGVMAPLSDKEIYSIVDAKLGYAEEADPAQIYVLDNPEKSPLKLYNSTPEGFIAAAVEGYGQPVLGPDRGLVARPGHGVDRPFGPAGKEAVISHVMSDTSFVKVPVDKQSISDRSPEDMAMAAANTIYTLRKRRIELITGEIGENVYGAGLKAALNEINRLEQEYMALFLGKQYRQRIVKVYNVIPKEGNNNEVVCRFSEMAGAVDAADVSARPIFLDMTPENKVSQTPIVNKPAKDFRGIVYSRIADMTVCRLMDGKNELAQDRIPVYQFGKVVQIPVTSIK